MKDLEPLKGEVNWYAKTMLTRSRQGDGLPDSIEIVDEVGRGSNNRVYRAVYKDETPVVVRTPRRKSDTERAGYAMWEFKHTLIASRLGVAPVLYDCWYNRHAKPKQRSGLFMIQEYFPSDLGRAMIDQQEEVLECMETITTKVTSHLKTIADADMLVYDLKPSNIVINMEDTVDVRLIDFGREFCEHGNLKEDGTRRTPVMNVARQLSRSYAKKHHENENSVYRHLLYSTMVIILAAITTFNIYENRGTFRADHILRARLNFMRIPASVILDETRGNFVRLIKEMLRQEDIRSMMRHYVGRRNSGTRRILRLARGQERSL